MSQRKGNDVSQDANLGNINDRHTLISSIGGDKDNSKNNSGDTQELDNSDNDGGLKSFPQSPKNPQYNRMKFYSALKTGYQQLNPEVKSGFLKAPKNLDSQYKYYVMSPFFKESGDTKTQSSIQTIFTCWNTMVGSGIVSLPWTFQESGFLLGLIICLVGLVASYRTCILMIRCAGNDNEYFDTLYKYWGKWAYYLGFISTLLIMIAAVTAYFINLSSMLYYLLLAILEWTGAINKDFAPVTTVDFGTFSQGYVTIFVFIMEAFITSKKDLSIFIRLMTYGSAFIMALIVFIIGFGFYGIATTKYEIIGPSEPYTFNPDNNIRNLKLFNSDFQPLAGALGIGYFLHTVSLPIVRNNAEQKNNERDVFFGYLLVGFTYMSVGLMGSIGFMGKYFDDYYIHNAKHHQSGPDTFEMSQNCMQMFTITDILAFIMRFALFALLFCCFPLINHFLRSLCLQLFFKDKEITDKIFYPLNITILLVPALITIFYPKIGSILGLIGAIAGLFIVYILPVITHLKKIRTEIEHPLLAKAIASDQYEFRTTGQNEFKSPKIVIRREIPGASQKINNRRLSDNISAADISVNNGPPKNYKPYYWEVFTHSLIILYGVAILIFTFYNPLKAPDS